MKVALKSELGETLTTVELNPKTFSTGSRGEHGNFKATNGGKRYQVNINAVEIHSKPSPKAVKAK